MRRFTKPSAGINRNAPHRVNVANWVQTPWGPEKRYEMLPTVYRNQSEAWAAIRSMTGHAEAAPVQVR